MLEIIQTDEHCATMTQHEAERWVLSRFPSCEYGDVAVVPSHIPRHMTKRMVAEVLQTTDPFGMAEPAEENYADYYTEIARMLESGTNLDELVTHLQFIACEQLCVPSREARWRTCAQALIDLLPEIRQI